MDAFNALRLRPHFLILPLAFTAACSSSDEGVDLGEPAVAQATEGTPLALTDSRACNLIGDCNSGQICFQNLCATVADTSAAATILEVVPDLSVASAPSRFQRILSGQTDIEIELKLDGPIPEGGLPYRIERSDDTSGQVPVVRFAQGTGDTISISVPVGDASPGTDIPDLVDVNYVTAAGTVHITLAPELPQEGTYGGEAVITTFGQLGLPMEVQIVTDPPGASLEAATAAYLVLPIFEGNLWNPMPATEGGPEFVTRELIYDDFVRAWVAQIEVPYEMTATSPFAWTATANNGVTRRLRFELVMAGEGVVTGNVSDRWSGLLEARTLAGVLEPSDVLFTGTFELQRHGAAPELASVTPPVDYPAMAAGLLPFPTIESCSGVDFSVGAQVDGVDVDCGLMMGSDDFLAADADAQAACALAMTEVALEGDTTASQIEAFLDDATPNPGGLSFADFMRACAAQQDGLCLASPEVQCGRQLSAYAIKNASETSAAVNDLLLAYQRGTREAFLGRQFAAFHADAQTRLDWLEAQDYPAIVTAAVQGLIQGLLDDWQNNVLEAHVGVLGGQFDSAGGAVLGQQITDEDALNRHRQVLFETSQSWRGAADALGLGAARWDTLLSDPEDRSVKATYVYQRTLDLYIVAGVLSEYNRQVGSGGNNAVFGGGFRILVRKARQLSFPFDRLIYDRQGEVVVSTSLDPQAGNATILAALQADAEMEVAGADEAVTQVIADSQAELLKQAELTSRIANEVDALESEMATLCGLPDGCTVPDDTACAIRVKIGQCGFRLDSNGEVLDAFPSDANPSEAGAAILEIRAALLELSRTQETVRAHAAQVELKHATAAAFADRVQGWNQTRQSLNSDLAGNLVSMAMSSNQAIIAIGASMTQQLQVRNERNLEHSAFIQEWDSIAVDGAASDLSDRVDIARLGAVSAGLNGVADAIDKKAKAITEGMPKSVGMSNDVSAVGRLAVLMSSYYVTTAMRVGALVADSAASRVERGLAEAQTLREAQLQTLEFSDDLAAAIVQGQIDSLRNQAALVEAATDFELQILREANDVLEREVDAALAYERDLVELRDRRDEVFELLIENDGLRLHVLQAELTVEQALAKYERLVQQAQLIEGRFLTVNNQLQNINQIVGSPTAVFAWANRLTRAEARLERAKGAVMEWLVALEYFAVRPFFDQRIQILLARNTTQLEAIAQDLQRIQMSCGGIVNNQTVEVSLREDLLGITQPTVDLQTDSVVTATERFRKVLQAGRIPVDKRVRYRTDTTVGDLLNRGGVLAATFDLGMDDFANLGTTCNAKMASVSLQLVGEGLGDALPVVNILYDGTSRLRSCQPDIKGLVELIGADITPFGEITELKTPGRSISTVAGISEFPASGSENRSLGGLPLVSQYTVLIDPTAGNNEDIDWSKLEDIILKVEYTYQDLFPTGQCQ